jgi:hypothetical protein
VAPISVDHGQSAASLRLGSPAGADDPRGDREQPWPQPFRLRHRTPDERNDQRVTRERRCRGSVSGCVWTIGAAEGTWSA